MQEEEAQRGEGCEREIGRSIDMLGNPEHSRAQGHRKGIDRHDLGAAVGRVVG